MSVTIRLYDQPYAPVAPSTHRAACVAAWLIERYGTAPQKRIEIYCGEPAAENDVTHNRDVLLSDEPGEFTVLELPGDGFSAFQIFQIVLAVYSVASTLLASRPQAPSNLNRNSASPNNDLGERTNQVRVLQRIEDIFGTVLAVPSLMMPTYNKYIDNVKVEFGYYCIGRGYYDITRVRDSDTLIADITGSSAAIYGPFTSPNSGDAPQQQIGPPIIDPILTVQRSEAVDGVTLKALNQLKFPDSASYTFTPTNGGDFIRQARKAPNFNSLLEPGDLINVAMPDQPVTITQSVTVTAGGFAGNFEISDGGGGEGAGGGGTGGEGGEGGG